MKRSEPIAVAVFAAVALFALAVVLTRSDGGSPPAVDPETARGEVLQETDPALAPVERDGPHIQAVVSAHELATEAGLEILARGGSAADAAVAVAATLSVVEPWFSSVLGGGTWALYYDASTGQVTSLDGVGPTGSHATVEAYAAAAERGGIHQSNVPGAWDGWMLWLEHYGRLDLGEVLEPAIRVAREGYAISPQMASWLDRSDILGRPDTARLYAPEGVVMGEGAIVFQHDMATTFEALAATYDEQLENGRGAAIQAARDYYYRGPLAEAIVRFSDEHGGFLALEDFHSFEAAIVEPIVIQYNDEIAVYQNPPNSQGITMLLALNILKGFDFTELAADSAAALHLQIEALKLAFGDRHAHVGDPARVDVPVARLLSDEHAESQRARIAANAVMSWPLDGSETQSRAGEVGDTTTFHIVDRDGNAAAVTTSLGAQFLVVGDTGIHMNNRMRMLSHEEGNPNLLTPGYKVRHTSNPYMALRSGIPYILGGNTGADTQAQAQLQQFINIVEFGMSAQEAVSFPRWETTSFPSGTYPHAVANLLEVEEGFSGEAIAALEALGHDVAVGGSYGSAGVIVLSEDGTGADLGVEPRSVTASGRSVQPDP